MQFCAPPISPRGASAGAEGAGPLHFAGGARFNRRNRFGFKLAYDDENVLYSGLLSLVLDGFYTRTLSELREGGNTCQSDRCLPSR